MIPRDGAKIFIKNPKINKFLFLLRDNKPGIPHPNKWSLFGGGIEKGETPIGALMREVKEETNIKIYNIKLLLSEEFTLNVENVPYKVIGHIFYAYTDAELQDIKLFEGQRVDYFSLDEIKSNQDVSGGMIKLIGEVEPELI